MLQSSPAPVASRATGAASALATGDRWLATLPRKPGLPCGLAPSPCTAEATAGAALVADCGIAATGVAAGAGDASGAVLGAAAATCGGAEVVAGVVGTTAITGRDAAAPVPRSAKARSSSPAIC